jgi:large subunit ribosomal protein L6
VSDIARRRKARKLTLSLAFHRSSTRCPGRGRDPVQTEIVIKGIDKQLVGQMAAVVRAHRPPGLQGQGCYAGERVIIKETKR